MRGMNIILLIISLVVSAIEIITVILNYKKDKTGNPQATTVLGGMLYSPLKSATQSK